MTTKNILIYLFQTLIGFIGHGIGLIIYPLAFLFRHKVLAWANSKLIEDEIHHVYELRAGVKWYHFIHPYFVLFWFFTGLDDKYSGPSDYKGKLKAKWFPEYGDIDFWFNNFPNVPSLKRKLQYFWLCYCWEAFRNGFYNWNMLWREGHCNEILEPIYVPYCNVDLPLFIMPQPKFDGKYLCYPFQAVDENDEWQTTHEGSKLMTFTTYRGNKRFYYGYCRIKRLKKHLRIVNLMFGWGWWNGIRELKVKAIFLKLDDKALLDYEKYLKTKV